MKELNGNLFNYPAQAICIPTNGYVSPNGLNVMGRGLAGEAKRRWPGIERESGFSISCFGNVPSLLTQAKGGKIYVAAERYGDYVSGPLPIPENAPEVPYHILTFPTKPGLVEEHELMEYYRKDQNKRPLKSGLFPGWMAPSNIELIITSTEILVEWTNTLGWTKVALSRVGCGLGQLDWEAQVKPAIQDLLDDRFVVVNK